MTPPVLPRFRICHPCFVDDAWRAARSGILALAVSAGILARAGAPAIFEQSFSHVQPGPVGADLMVLDGQFSIKEEDGNRFLELPGSPLDTFGVLFGPSRAEGVQVQARIFATKQGRKFPVFAAGLNGGGGFKLRVSPSKRVIEILRGDDIKATAPFDWRSGEWTSLKLQVRKVGDVLKVQGRVWQGATEPAEWSVTLDEKEPVPAGKAGVWGMPFSGTPVRFDDLRIVAAE